jgi:hypothetical protein
MGPLERISSARLPNEETSPFQGLNFAILPELYHEMVKDLGLESRRTTRSLKEVSSSDGQVQVDTISPISTILQAYVPRKPQELSWAYRLSVRSVSSQGDECIHIS